MSGAANGKWSDEEIAMVARVATDAANEAVSPVMGVMARTARASEYAAQMAGAAASNTYDLKERVNRMRLSQEAAVKQLSAELADVMVAVLQSAAKDSTQDKAIADAKEAAERARLVASEAAERASEKPNAELKARQQSEEDLAKRLHLATIRNLERGGAVEHTKSKENHKALLKVVVVAATTVILTLGVLLKLALMGLFH